jgi:hypothetical protein
MGYSLDKALIWVGAVAVASVVVLNLFWFQ